MKKEEQIGYLKSALNLMQGTLTLDNDKLILDAHKTGVGGMGLIGSLLKKKVESKSFGFETQLTEIKSVEQGKHGVEKNVLEITLSSGEQYKVIVKDFNDWKSAIGV